MVGMMEHSNKKIFSFLLFILLTHPFITNGIIKNSNDNYAYLGDSITTHYNVEQFDGEDTNWFVQQHRNGVIFLSNDNGLYSFDGANWRTYQLNAGKLSDIRQFRIHTDGKIYIGGQADFGYFEPTSNGDLQYVSLLHLLPEGSRQISTVNNVFVHSDKIFFVTPEQIMAYTSGKEIQIWKPKTQFSRMWQAGNKLFFNDGSELKFFKDDQIFPTPFNESMGIKSYGFVQSIDQGYLIGTFSQGIFLWQGKEVTTWMPSSHPNARLGLYNSTKINDQLFAVSTINGGVLFLNHRGKTVYQLNTKNGLVSDITVNIFLDNQQGLWLAQQGHLTRTQLPFELSTFSDVRHTIAKIRAFTRVDDTLFLSAVNGIKTIDDTGELSNYPQALTSTADLIKIKDKLLIAGAQQCQILDPKTGIVTPLLETAMCRDVLLSQQYADTLFIITEHSVAYSVWKNNAWQTPVDLLQTNHITSELVEDGLGQIWTANRSGDLVRFWYDKSWQFEVISADQSEVTPLIFDGKLLIASDRGLFHWDYETAKLAGQVDWFYEHIGIQADAPYFLYQDLHQRLWLASSETAGYFTLEQGKPSQWNNYPVTASGMSRLRRVFDDDNVIWLGFDNGIVRYIPQAEKSNNSNTTAFISELRVKDPDSPLSLDVFKSTNELIKSSSEHGSIRAYFGLSSYLQHNENKFRYRLNDDPWSAWTKENYIDLGQLSGGDYKLEMQAKDFQMKVYSAMAKPFKVIPPWYLGTFAYLFYGLLGVILIFVISTFVANFRTRKILQQKELLEKEVAARTETIQEQANQLEVLGEAKSKFFANVSHEFRTPLTLAIGPLQELIRNKRINNPQDQQHLKIALDNSQQMLSLVGQILDINRLESGEMQLAISPLDLGKKLSSILERYKLLADKRKIKLNSKNLDTTIKIYFDPDHLDKIMNNLLSNAFKFSAENTQIELGMSQDLKANQVTIWLKDEGQCISEVDRHHIFERYFQGQNISNLQPGTGIGLSYVKELLDLHSGNIALDAKYQQGALFKITLNLGSQHYASKHFVEPLGQTTSSPLIATYHALKSGSGKIKVDDLPKVLVVDDNEDLLYFIRTSLKSSYHIIEARNGEDALRLVQKEHPDFIISDIMMPIMDGLELVKKLKADPTLAHIPLLLLTAKATKRDTVKGLQQGADDYLTKPFDSSELIARIDSHLIQKRNIARSLYQSFKKKNLMGAGLPKNIKKINNFTTRFINIIDEKLADPDFDVASMASVMNVERSTLFRKVKKVFNCTPNQYVKKRRLELAIKMLQQKSGSMSEIAYAVGFQSLSYFSRCFSEEYNIPPSQYQAIV